MLAQQAIFLTLGRNGVSSSMLLCKQSLFGKLDTGRASSHIDIDDTGLVSPARLCLLVAAQQ